MVVNIHNQDQKEGKIHSEDHEGDNVLEIMRVQPYHLIMTDMKECGQIISVVVHSIMHTSQPFCKHLNINMHTRQLSLNAILGNHSLLSITFDDRVNLLILVRVVNVTVQSMLDVVQNLLNTNLGRLQSVQGLLSHQGTGHSLLLPLPEDKACYQKDE